jgi:hypothetical protein
MGQPSARPGSRLRSIDGRAGTPRFCTPGGPLTVAGGFLRVSDGTRTRDRLDHDTAQWLFPGALRRSGLTCCALPLGRLLAERDHR